MDRRAFLQGGVGAIVGSTLLPSQSWAALPHLTLQLDWVLDVQFAGVLLAQYQGLYRQQGLTVTIQPWRDGLDVLEQVTNQPLTLGCAEQNLILQAVSQGKPIQAIATMLQSIPLGLMSLPGSEIRTLADLVGKTVGMHGDGVKVLQMAAQQSGLSADAIAILDIPYQDKEARLQRGELAAVQCYVTSEPIALSETLGAMPEVIELRDYGYEAYSQVIFASELLLKQYPDLVRKFLQATFQGWQLALMDIPAAARLVVEHFIPDANLKAQTQSLELLAHYVWQGNAPLGSISRQRWQRMSDRLVQYHLIEPIAQPQTALNLEFWSG